MRLLILATALGLAALPARADDLARVPRPRPVLAGEEPAVPPAPDIGASMASDSAPPLPRVRPSVEPKRELADWAGNAAYRFKAASGDGQPQPVGPEPPPPQAAAGPGEALDAIEGVAPLPRPRPARSGPELALMMPPKVEPHSPGLVAPEDAACVGRLRDLGVVFTEEDPMDIGGTCSVPHPLKVTSLGSGIAIGPETILNCAETESLARWMKEVVVPSASRLLGSAPNSITQDSAYVCRTRYNDPHQKISEHAHANALDIAAFSFAGRAPVEIGRNSEGSPEAAFEAEIRKGSCTYFTTVLGPGSNAAHATHFHLDMAFRRGGYRLCELGAPTTVALPAKTKRE